MALALDQLVELIDDAVSTLDATPFALDLRSTGAESESWHHSTAPFDETATAGGKQHLEYVVQVDAVGEAPEYGGRDQALLMEAQISVSFDFQIHPSSQVADYRKAMRAAALVVGKMKRIHVWGRDYGAYYERCPQRFQPEPTEQRLRLSVKTTHLIRYQEAF